MSGKILDTFIHRFNDHDSTVRHKSKTPIREKREFNQILGYRNYVAQMDMFFFILNLTGDGRHQVLSYRYRLILHVLVLPCDV